MIQNRNIQLNLLKPSTCKSVVLDALFESYNLACSDCLGYWKSNKGITQTAFHHATYKDIRGKYKLPADYTISARVTAWNRRKITKIIKCVPIRLTNKLFSCSECGLTAHRDRVASTNIANSVLERTDLVSTTNSIQTSKTEEPVTVPVCVNDVESFGVVHLNGSPEAKSPKL